MRLGIQPNPLSRQSVCCASARSKDAIELRESSPDLIASERNIHVWLAFYDEIVDESVCARLRTLLSEAERAQEFRFHFADDQKRHLITRALVRTVLSRYVAIAPTEWTFSTNRFGRPQISNQEIQARQLSFNISHTRGLIALAVTHGLQLGVDVENVSARKISLDIADHYFAPTEVAELARVPSDRQQDRFFEYWTFKESYIKARGMGLSIPLDQFSFHYPHEGAVRIQIQPALGDESDRWSFWQFRPTPENLLALCVERRDGPAPNVTIRKATWADGDEIVELRLSKSSEAPASVLPGASCQGPVEATRS
jgi:4'-phosphopantetheinyl transferase